MAQRIPGDFSFQAPAAFAEHVAMCLPELSASTLIATDFYREKPTWQFHALASSGEDIRLPSWSSWKHFYVDSTILILSLFLEMGEPFKMTFPKRIQPEAGKQHDILQEEELKHGKVLSCSK